ncbi:MAG: hypothetical protein GX493_09960 [Firmicutes bacterium]|nr:hypothetical protein [Bacillota bacterium]
MASDWRISSLLHDTVKQFEEHSKRVESILDTARLKFEQDYTGTTAGAGLILLAASLCLAFLDKNPLITVVGITGGILLIISALFFRHRNGESQVKNAEQMIELERERALFAQRSAVLEHIWVYGLPEGTPLAQIQLLLGDSSATPVDKTGAPLRWRALPESKPSSSDENEKDKDTDDAPPF